MKKSLIILALSLFIFSSCNNNSSVVSEYASDSVSKDPNDEVIESLMSFKEKLLVLDGNVSKKSYSTQQINNYSALNMEVEENGTLVRYQDNFVVNEFSQKINEGKPSSGHKERGVFDSERLYQITYYGDKDSANSVTYFVNNENNLNTMFNIGFATEYSSNMIDFTIMYFETAKTEHMRLELKTNFNNIEFVKNGTITLQYRFIYYAPTGKTKLEEVQRDDTLTIKNGVIIKSETEMLYGQQDSINYQHMTSVSTYDHEEITAFTGVKLNPTDFQTL
ncbi:MAG: hypothetical protein J1F32_02215 [Erysipelotrichales bacterium]|nr:hypothetical protein [Erysipelotrichales bacterium]